MTGVTRAGLISVSSRLAVEAILNCRPLESNKLRLGLRRSATMISRSEASWLTSKWLEYSGDREPSTRFGRTKLSRDLDGTDRASDA